MIVVYLPAANQFALSSQYVWSVYAVFEIQDVVERPCVGNHDELTLLKSNFDFVVADAPDWSHCESRHVAQHVIVEGCTDFSAVQEVLCCFAFKGLYVGVKRHHPAVVWPVFKQAIKDDFPEFWNDEWHIRNFCCRGRPAEKQSRGRVDWCRQAALRCKQLDLCKCVEVRPFMYISNSATPLYRIF